MRLSTTGALVALLATGCSVGLEHGLDEAQANEVVAALDRAGVAAEKSPDEAVGRWRVLVGRGEMAHAVAVLETAGLPRPPAKGVGETFAEAGLLPSARAERARLAASLSADLSRTLEGLPGVARARVHVALPDDDGLRDDDSHPRTTAAVAVQASGTLAIGESDLRKLVAAAVPGLDATDVDLVLSAAPVASPSPSLVSLGPVRVAAESRGLAIAILSVLLAILLVLSTAVAWGVVRIGALRRDRDGRA